MKIKQTIEKNGLHKSYEDKIHRYGRLSGILVLCMIIGVPLIINLKYNIVPPMGNLLNGLGLVCMIYIPISVAEFLTYTPMLGSSASYLVFVTGNLTNLKIPCAITCMENAGVKPQTEEGEVIASIAVATSSIVTILIVLLGMLAIVPLKPILNAPELKPAFEHILPALFGGLAAYWVQKQWKLAFVPIGIVILLFISFSIPSAVQGVLIPVMGLVSVISARIMYKKGFIKEV